MSPFPIKVSASSGSIFKSRVFKEISKSKRLHWLELEVDIHILHDINWLHSVVHLVHWNPFFFRSLLELVVFIHKGFVDFANHELIVVRIGLANFFR